MTTPVITSLIVAAEVWTVVDSALSLVSEGWYGVLETALTKNTPMGPVVEVQVARSG